MRQSVSSFPASQLLYATTLIDWEFTGICVRADVDGSMLMISSVLCQICSRDWKLTNAVLLLATPEGAPQCCDVTILLCGNISNCYCEALL